jgi:hypothetical protein
MGLTKSSERTRNWIFAIDGAVLALILLIGAIQFTYYPHTADFVSDPGYPDMARSFSIEGRINSTICQRRRCLPVSR